MPNKGQMKMHRPQEYNGLQETQKQKVQREKAEFEAIRLI